MPIAPPSEPSSGLTPEMAQQMQQMIQSAFSALKLSGTSTNTSIWYMDSGN